VRKGQSRRRSFVPKADFASAARTYAESFGKDANFYDYLTAP